MGLTGIIDWDSKKYFSRETETRSYYLFQTRMYHNYLSPVCRNCRSVGRFVGLSGVVGHLSECQMSGVVGHLSGVCRALCFGGHTLSVVLRSCYARPLVGMSECRNVGMSEPLSDCRNVCVGSGWGEGCPSSLEG